MNGTCEWRQPTASIPCCSLQSSQWRSSFRAHQRTSAASRCSPTCGRTSWPRTTKERAPTAIDCMADAIHEIVNFLPATSKFPISDSPNPIHVPFNFSTISTCMLAICPHVLCRSFSCLYLCLSVSLCLSLFLSLSHPSADQLAPSEPTGQRRRFLHSRHGAAAPRLSDPSPCRRCAVSSSSIVPSIPGRLQEGSDSRLCLQATPRAAPGPQIPSSLSFVAFRTQTPHSPRPRDSPRG